MASFLLSNVKKLKSYGDNLPLSTEKAIKVLSPEKVIFVWNYMFGVVNMHRYAKNRPLRGHFKTKVNTKEFKKKWTHTKLEKHEN